MGAIQPMHVLLLLPIVGLVWFWVALAMRVYRRITRR